MNLGVNRHKKTAKKADGNDNPQGDIPGKIIQIARLAVVHHAKISQVEVEKRVAEVEEPDEKK